MLAWEKISAGRRTALFIFWTADLAAARCRAVGRAGRRALRLPVLAFGRLDATRSNSSRESSRSSPRSSSTIRLRSMRCTVAAPFRRLSPMRTERFSLDSWSRMVATASGSSGSRVARVPTSCRGSPVSSRSARGSMSGTASVTSFEPKRLRLRITCRSSQLILAGVKPDAAGNAVSGAGVNSDANTVLAVFAIRKQQSTSSPALTTQLRVRLIVCRWLRNSPRPVPPGSGRVYPGGSSPQQESS